LVKETSNKQDRKKKMCWRKVKGKVHYHTEGRGKIRRKDNWTGGRERKSPACKKWGESGIWHQRDLGTEKKWVKTASCGIKGEGNSAPKKNNPMGRKGAEAGKTLQVARKQEEKEEKVGTFHHQTERWGEKESRQKKSREDKGSGMKRSIIPRLMGLASKVRGRPKRGDTQCGEKKAIRVRSGKGE